MKKLHRTSSCCMCLLSHVWLCNPIDYSPPGSSVHGIFQAEYWSGLLFPSPGHQSQVSYTSGKPKTSSATATARSLQLCPTLCDPIDGSPPSLPRPWDSPGKNTGVGCHFLLQCRKLKSESEVAQSCLTPSDPMDCSLPGSSVHGIFQARVLEWGAIAFSENLI